MIYTIYYTYRFILHFYFIVYFFIILILHIIIGSSTLYWQCSKLIHFLKISFICIHNVEHEDFQLTRRCYNNMRPADHNK